jgi:PEP-CTERM/exosortase A-associated glycosyltransferase
MRILHVLDHSIPLQSGYAFRTLAILREQRRLGWQTFHLTTPKHLAKGADEETVDGWHFFRTPGAPGRVPVVSHVALMRRVLRRLDEVARRVQPDVIHAHSPVLNALPALRVGRRLGVPVVYEVRAFWEDAAVDLGVAREGGLRYRATRAIETYALNAADRVTTICEGLRNDMLARGVPASKVTVIPNAVDVAAFSPGGTADEALKARLGIGGCTVLGFVGSFYAYEGLDLLIAALPRIVARCGDARVLLVGGGPHEAALRDAVQRLRLEASVVMPGRVAHADVQRYYDAIDVLAYPRRSMRLTELVTPLKPLEAMAQGRLVVASDVGGHRELIRDGNTGVLFRAGDVDSLVETVARVLAERDRWPAMRAAARRFVEIERNWPASVARYADVYNSVLHDDSAAVAA